ncbi:TonB-dependent siderophore receptor [Nostoc sp. ChiVER01]|uniref:TonB-dependent siderophore receptor n=1 Tax=Nostoc sp. ChiVER01 TaxID=3075382 RepID=UPI002AD375DE|nr:TonB-dependent siderophore receptor [Nostoc sp. ChiVER01]MDZ8227264.1 TonB-dependent siderophore receptor [Nostoc sp. ChiVER01]
MKPEQFVHSFLFTVSVVMLIATPVQGEQIAQKEVKSSFSYTETGESANQAPPKLSKSQAVEPSRKIRPLSEIIQPLTNAQMLEQSSKLSQAGSSEVIQITGVRVNPTAQGVEVILETPSGDKLQVLPKSEGSAYIADIPNTQLRLAGGNVFRQEKPVAGITEITVSNQDANAIRLAVIGETALPKVELFDSDEGLIFGFVTTPTSTTAPQEPGTAQTPEAQPQQEPETAQTPSSQQPSEGETPPQSEGETQPEQPTAETDEPIELVVTGEQDGYNASNATTGTRTDTRIFDIPQSVQVVPEKVIEDQQIIRLDEALNNVSNVISGGFDTGSEARYTIRGFDNAPVLIDGFRQYDFQEVPETANIERIEVLKGPASVLYGEIQPGGIVNVVTKKPLTEPFYEAELQFGNYGLIRPRIDISGPLTTNGQEFYRLNLAYLNSDGFRDFDQNFEQFFLAPALTWKFSDRTNLTIDLQYSYRRRPQDTGLVALGDRVIDLPRDRVLNEPDDYIERNFVNTGYSLEHRFSDNWTIRNAFRYATSSVFSDRLTIPIAFDETTGDLTRVYAYDDFNSDDYSLQTNVVGKFATGSIKHTLLFGVDLNRNNSTSFARSNFSNPVSINVFNPVYDSSPRPELNDLLFDSKSTTDRFGIYIQDEIAFFDNFKLLAGLRYETVNQKVQNEPAFFNSGDDTSQFSNALTPRIGIVYQPIKQVSLYGSYSQSFNPNVDVFSVDGSPLEPERGEGYEIGIKTELLEGRIFATLAYFDITKTNVATEDPNFPGLGFSVATGEQRSRGFEFDISGQILPGWNIIASYAYTDAEITDDTDRSIVGNTLTGVPRNSASLWTTYELQSGSLQGLGFGVGFNFIGEREGDLENTFNLDSYFLTNAAVFYRRDNWRFALNFKNVFDVNYITGVPFSRISGIYPGEPFTVIGSISVQF